MCSHVLTRIHTLSIQTGLGREVRGHGQPRPVPPRPQHGAGRAPSRGAWMRSIGWIRFGGQPQTHTHTQHACALYLACIRSLGIDLQPVHLVSVCVCLCVSVCSQVPPDVTPGAPLLSKDANHLVYVGWDDKPRRLGMVSVVVVMGHTQSTDRQFSRKLTHRDIHLHTYISHNTHTDLLLPTALPYLCRGRFQPRRRTQPGMGMK